jgi:hypothetical protein
MTMPATGAPGASPAPNAAPSAAPKPPTPAASPTGVPNANAAKAEAEAAKPQVRPDPNGKPPADKTLPDEAGRVTISQQALKERLQRATASELKKHFGTDDINAIKAKVQQSEEFQKKQEEARRAQLSENQRIQEDNKRLAQEKLKLEQKLKTMQRTSALARQESHLVKIASQFVNDGDVGDVMAIFARHVREMPPAQREALDDVKVKDWFAKYVAKKPAFARPGVINKPKPRAPMTNGAGGARPGGNPPAPASGSPSPSAPNYRPGGGLSSREVMAKSGHRW